MTTLANRICKLEPQVQALETAVANQAKRMDILAVMIEKQSRALAMLLTTLQPKETTTESGIVLPPGAHP